MFFLITPFYFTVKYYNSNISYFVFIFNLSIFLFRNNINYNYYYFIVILIYNHKILAALQTSTVNLKFEIAF